MSNASLAQSISTKHRTERLHCIVDTEGGRTNMCKWGCEEHGTQTRIHVLFLTLQAWTPVCSWQWRSDTWFVSVAGCSHQWKETYSGCWRCCKVALLEEDSRKNWKDVQSWREKDGTWKLYKHNIDVSTKWIQSLKTLKLVKYLQLPDYRFLLLR